MVKYYQIYCIKILRLSRHFVATPRPPTRILVLQICDKISGYIIPYRFVMNLGASFGTGFTFQFLASLRDFHSNPLRGFMTNSVIS